LPFHYFVGRDDDLVQIGQRLASTQTRAVIITGFGGMGKSALAAEAARRHARRYPGGIVWIEAHEGEDFGRDTVLAEVVRVLGLSAESEEDLEGVVLRHMRAQPCLLVLDNLERPPADWADLASFLSRLDPVHGSQAILTARPQVEAVEELSGSWALRLRRLVRRGSEQPKSWRCRVADGQHTESHGILPGEH